MIKTKLIILFAMSYFFIFASNAQARTPAVEPVMSFPIDQYKNVPPSEAKGFNFSKQTKKASAKYPKRKLAKASVKDFEKKSNLPVYVAIFFFMAIPAALIFAINSNLKKNEQEISDMDLKVPDNVYDLNSHRLESTTHSSDDDDYKKAG